MNLRIIQVRVKQLHIKDTLNGTTLADMKFSESELIAAFPKVQAMAKKAPIMRDHPETGEPELTLRAHQIIEEIFLRFATDHDGFMGFNQNEMMTFIATSTNTKVEEDDQRLAVLKEKYCQTKPEIVGVDDLKKFYFDKCLEGNEETIRKNFKDLGYANDLQRIPQDGDPSNVLQARESKEKMPRYMIAASQENFDVLLSLFDTQTDVREKALEFMRLLCTNPILMTRILELKSEEGQDFCWNLLF
mmetsp:Transcript_39087/g.59593  ORF Transcript_39087/g.59593 Transcript_39087/m.59593 type:complete len:246 (-) Transcript_39087:4436-5173(-)